MSLPTYHWHTLSGRQGRSYHAAGSTTRTTTHDQQIDDMGMEYTSVQQTTGSYGACGTAEDDHEQEQAVLFLHGLLRTLSIFSMQRAGWWWGALFMELGQIFPGSLFSNCQQGSCFWDFSLAAVEFQDGMLGCLARDNGPGASCRGLRMHWS